jgi:hypothetical protein
MNFKFALYLFVIIGFSLARADAYVDFFRAVKTDNASAVTALLASGLDPNALSEGGQTPLYLAIKDESPKVVGALLANPAVKIDQVNAAGETAVMMAALRGRLDWTRQLVAMGAKVRRDGWTPLHYAASGPNVEVVRFLLDQGADVDAIAPNGASPLMMAARYGAEDSVRLLIARGADKRVRNSLNQSAADYARIAGRDFLLPLLQ